MPDGTETLVLEPLRGPRGGIGAFRAEVDKRFATVDTWSGAIQERLGGIDTQREGWRHVLVAATGSLVADLKDQEVRIAQLEGIPA